MYHRHKFSETTTYKLHTEGDVGRRMKLRRYSQANPWYEEEGNRIFF
jgi:hypothetical protein